MTGSQTLVLGVGNVLLGDEGAGVYVIRRLQELPLPSGIVIMDGGTAGLNLLPYLQGWRRVIVADAILGGGEPGTVYRLTPADLAVSRPGLSLHQVDLAWLLRLSDAEVIVYAIDLGGAAPQEFKVGLSPPIACAVEQVVAHIREELGSPPPANAGVSLPTGGF